MLTPGWPFDRFPHSIAWVAHPPWAFGSARVGYLSFLTILFRLGDGHFILFL